MDNNRINNISLDKSVSVTRLPEVEHEYKTATADLLENNYFCLGSGDKLGPYDLHLSIADNRIVLDITWQDSDKDKKTKIKIPTTPLRKTIKDYFIVCESYYKALRETTPRRMETIDMARRGLHNEGSDILLDMLRPEIDVDFDTARRLFTLFCILHIR